MNNKTTKYKGFCQAVYKLHVCLDFCQTDSFSIFSNILMFNVSKIYTKHLKKLNNTALMTVRWCLW